MNKKNEKKLKKGKSEKYILEKNGPSDSTFFEPSEISPEFKESLFYLGLLYKQALHDRVEH